MSSASARVSSAQMSSQLPIKSICFTGNVTRALYHAALLSLEWWSVFLLLLLSRIRVYVCICVSVSRQLAVGLGSSLAARQLRKSRQSRQQPSQLYEVQLGPILSSGNKISQSHITLELFTRNESSKQ